MDAPRRRALAFRVPWRRAMWSTLAYVGFGAAWIFGSDHWLNEAELGPEAAAAAALIKGLVFVLISAGWGVALLTLSLPVSADADPPQRGTDRPRRLLGLVLSSLLLVPLVDLAILHIHGGVLDKQALQAQQAQAEERARRIGDWLQHHRETVRVLAASSELQPALAAAELPAMRARIEQRLADATLALGLQGVALLDEQGRLLAAVGQPVHRAVGTDAFGVRLSLRHDATPDELALSAEGQRMQLRLRLTEVQPEARPLQLTMEMSIQQLFQSPSQTQTQADPSQQVLLLVPQAGSAWLLPMDSAPRQPRPLDPAALAASAGFDAALAHAIAGQVLGSDGPDDRVAWLTGFAPVPGTDWRLLVRTPQAAVRSSLLPLIAWVSAILLLSIATIAAVLVMLWRDQMRVDGLRLQSLQSANDRLMRQFFELPFVGIAFASGDARHWLSFNDRLCAILGYDRETLQQKRWSDLVHPDEIAPMRQMLEKMRRGESDGSLSERRLLRRDGSILPVELEVKCVRRADDGIEMLVATVDDISQDVQAREALRQSEQRLHLAVQEAPYPTIVLAEDGEIVELSRSWCEQSGYRREQLQSIDDWLRLSAPPADLASTRAHIQQLFGSAARVNEGDFAIRNADGFQRTWMFSSAPLGPAADGRRLIVTTAIDVTEQRQLEHVLQESNALYLQMFNANPISMYVWDAQTRDLLAVNDATVQTYGWSREDMLGMRLDDLRPPREIDRLLAMLQTLQRSSVSKPGVWTHRRHDGSEFQVETSLHAMRFGNREAWLTMAIDVSERERARSEIERYVRRLEAATESTFAVISSMVELRDPYTAGHERRVGEIAAAIAAEMGLDPHVQQGLRLCGAVHDVGKIGIPAEILSKPSRLSEAEMMLVRQHAALGYEILKTIDLPWPIAEVARQHHERIDGSGYPRGLRGEDILLEARIVAVADVVESMASHRPYRPSIGVGIALQEIRRGRDLRYDAQVVDACLRLFEDKAYALPA